MLTQMRAAAALVLTALALSAAPALAREPFEDIFYVKRGGTAAQMFEDRVACRREALGLGSTASSYSNPQYGALTAMGQALDSDALHEGGLRKRMELAVLTSCMGRLGWTQKALGPDDRAVARSSPRKPEALDAWLKANEPPLPPPAPPPPPAAKPVAQPVTTPPAATAPATPPAKPAAAPN